jgi:hypothetical protein
VRTLTIALEDGFVDDRVVVTVDGKVVLDEEHVRTRTQTGLARLVEAKTAAAGDSRIEVALPARGLHTAVRTDARRAPNVRVSIQGGRLAATASPAPLFYA